MCFIWSQKQLTKRPTGSDRTPLLEEAPCYSQKCLGDHGLPIPKLKLNNYVTDFGALPNLGGCLSRRWPSKTIILNTQCVIRRVVHKMGLLMQCVSWRHEWLIWAYATIEAQSPVWPSLTSYCCCNREIVMGLINSTSVVTLVIVVTVSLLSVGTGGGYRGRPRPPRAHIPDLPLQRSPRPSSRI